MDHKVFQYFSQYKWSNILALLRNSFREPASCSADFRGKLVVITGATSGIGRAAARKFASRGANLLCVNRNPEKSSALSRELETEFGIRCRCLIADLSELPQILRVARELAQTQEPIDVLIHNAGVYLTKRELNSEGLEKLFVVHYLAFFLITFLLREKLRSQGRARILTVGSEGHRFAVWGLRLDDLNWTRRRYSGWGSYGSAKTAQLLAMLCFAQRFRGTGVTINTMHPGAVTSAAGQDNGPLYRWLKKNLFDPTLKSPEMSAEALFYLAAAPELEGVSGKFFHLTTPEDPAPPARDREVAWQLWRQTLLLAGLEEA